MKTGAAALWILLVGTASFAQNASSSGTWKLDVKQSDFGSEPAPKSLTVTVKDTGKTVSIHGHGIDDKGKNFSFSWNGPEDGSMRPMMEDGKVTGKANARKEGHVLVRHGEGTDGSSFDERVTLSSDGNTKTSEWTVKSNDGKETKAKLVLHRVPAQKTTENKSQ
jgi:hypothetical protein